MLAILPLAVSTQADWANMHLPELPLVVTQVFSSLAGSDSFPSIANAKAKVLIQKQQGSSASMHARVLHDGSSFPFVP